MPNNQHLAPYELERLERIERNQKQLADLGLDNFKLSKARQHTNIKKASKSDVVVVQRAPSMRIRRKPPLFDGLSDEAMLQEEREYGEKQTRTKRKTVPVVRFQNSFASTRYTRKQDWADVDVARQKRLQLIQRQTQETYLRAQLQAQQKEIGEINNVSSSNIPGVSTTPIPSTIPSTIPCTTSIANDALYQQNLEDLIADLPILRHSMKNTVAMGAHTGRTYKFACPKCGQYFALRKDGLTLHQHRDCGSVQIFF